LPFPLPIENERVLRLRHRDDKDRSRTRQRARKIGPEAAEVFTVEFLIKKPGTAQRFNIFHKIGKAPGRHELRLKTFVF
jgi:hypothetical protein